jgi:hypothetical protein
LGKKPNTLRRGKPSSGRARKKQNLLLATGQPSCEVQNLLRYSPVF